MATAVKTGDGEHAPIPLSSKLAVSGSVPTELAVALAEIQNAFPARFTKAAAGWKVCFHSTPEQKPGFTIATSEQQTIHISYTQPAAAFRALGILMGQLECGHAPAPLCQHSVFRTCGAMLDVSRNGVPHVATVRKFIRHFALMGINQLMLYMEDTYEIPGEPVFGYFRGGYSQQELRNIDDYAASFGIEVVPCIQTLGHLEQMLQWPCYSQFRDAGGVLLTGEERTDAFVEKMIEAASAPFRSKRIHIGMDEAHGIGSGIYRLKNGLRAPFDILCEHLQKTVATCERRGLTPMIWSDMFFRLGSKTNNYYDPESRIDPAIAKKIPKNVDLVYWDYYHTQGAFYDEWIERHRQMGKLPVFAGGIWSWNRFWAQLPHSAQTLRAGIAAARRAGLQDVFVTQWGDDGMECDTFSILPAMQIFADLSYGQAEETEASSDEPAQGGITSHAANFAGSTDGTFDSWFAASQISLVPVESSADYDANACKWLFWHDPLIGHFEQQIRPEYLEHFKRVVSLLDAVPSGRAEDERLNFMRTMAAALALKTELHLTLRRAYRNNDLPALHHLEETLIGQLRDTVCTLRDMHEARWHDTFRSLGWEVLERRYAGLLSRLETLQRKLRKHLLDPACKIEELEYEPVRLWPDAQTQNRTITHRQTATPTCNA